MWENGSTPNQNKTKQNKASTVFMIRGMYWRIESNSNTVLNLLQAQIHNAPVPYPMMHRFVVEMFTYPR